MRISFVAPLLFLLLCGCGTVKLQVPEGREVRLLEEDEPASIHLERKLWFWQWGGKPISENTTKPEIEAYNLREIRIITVQTFFDNLITAVTSLVSVTRITLIVDGNP